MQMFSTRRTLAVVCLYLIFILFPIAGFGENTSPEIQTVGQINQWTTQNGMKVLYQQAETLPIIDIRLIFDAGGARDVSTQRGLAGTAKLTNGLIFEGADKLSADQIADKFASLGVEYGNGSYRDMALVNLRTLSYPQQRDAALELLAHVLSTATFPEEALKRESDRMLAALDYEDQTPAKKASRFFYESLYTEHPYGSPPDGTRDSLKKITRADLQTYYKRFFVAKNAVLAMVGDLNLTQAKAYAEKISQAFPSGEKVSALPAVESLSKNIVLKEEHPATQTTMLMGAPMLKRGDEDYYPLYVGNHILGGSGFSSRLMKEVRVKRGLTYSIGSYLVPMREKGPYQFSFTTKKSSTEEAIKLVDENLHKFIQQGPTVEELEEAKLNITGSFPLRMASNKSIVENLAVIGFYDLPLDYLDEYNKHIESVTIEQIKDVYKRLVNPDKMATIVVGPQMEQLHIKTDKVARLEAEKASEPSIEKKSKN